MTIQPKVSQEATWDHSGAGQVCGAICKRWGGAWQQEFAARVRPPAPQLEAVWLLESLYSARLNRYE
jgi:hypothetical protein